MPRTAGRSRAVSFASELKVESSVEPAHMTIMAAMRKKAPTPIPWATTCAASVTSARPARRASMPMKEKSRMATKPSRPATVKHFSIFFSSQIKPRSVRTASWKPYERHWMPAPKMKSTPASSAQVEEVK